jgi:hypothetical protein
LPELSVEVLRIGRARQEEILVEVAEGAPHISVCVGPLGPTRGY